MPFSKSSFIWKHTAFPSWQGEMNPFSTAMVPNRMSVRGAMANGTSSPVVGNGLPPADLLPEQAAACRLRVLLFLSGYRLRVHWREFRAGDPPQRRCTARIRDRNAHVPTNMDLPTARTAR